MTIDVAQPRPVENPPIAREEITFSHPSEEELARILDFYGIAWRYEPTTFPLRWDEQGNVLEAFSPDFYLVQEDLYVELTTLRQSLMRIKHRKIRRLKELYPWINIKLWDRKDFMHLLERFGVTGREQELVGKEAIGQ
jgi:hypoxanthine phosphoribosyltransferase